MHLPTQLQNGKHARLVVPAVAIICAVVLSGCQGSTIPATNVGTATATLNAQASCSGGVPTPCSWYWRWGTNGQYQYSSAISGPLKATWSGTLSYTATGLTPGTTYGYQVCGKGDAVTVFACLGSANGSPSQFTTESSGSSSVAFVQADDTGTINGNTTSISSGKYNQVLTHNTGIGHSVVLEIQTLTDPGTQTDTVTSISSGMGTFQFVNSYNDGADTEIWVCLHTTGAADTLTVNTPTNAWNAFAVEFNAPAIGFIERWGPGR